MRLKLITSNPGKVIEYQHYFNNIGIETIQMNESYDEIQSTCLENVVNKAMKELKGRGLSDFIIDDSGLFIDGLNGFPGVWSAYIQKTIGNKGVLKLMEGIPKRDAAFKCCIGLNIGGEDIVVTGVCLGLILEEERGNGGFGYDPIFSANGVESFAEISLNEKNKLSHRGHAIRLLINEMRLSGFFDGKP